MTAADIRAFLEAAGWGDATTAPLAGDASARRYLRVCQGPHSAVLMLAPVASADDRDSLDNFLHMAGFLRGCGLAAPEIHATARQSGLILMQDFGDLSLARVLDTGEATEAYAQAAEIPCLIARAPPPVRVARPDTAAQADMAALTFDLLGEAGRFRDDLRPGLIEALGTHAGGEPALSLRDYHAENLIWCRRETGARRIGLLDFQDAVMLPAGYDLASLVDDPRRIVPLALRQHLIAAFAGRTGSPLPEAQARVDTLSLLRNLRILGIFHRLSQSGKPAYRRFLPRTNALVARAASNPALAALRDPVADVLARAARWSAEDAS